MINRRCAGLYLLVEIIRSPHPPASFPTTDPASIRLISPMRTQLTSAHPASRGFSLVEMLTVISVIGIIASIAIPNIGSISDSAKTATRQRNGQCIVSMFSAGQAAGVIWTGSTRNALVSSVITGQSPTDGAFSGKIFRVPNITGAELTATYPYVGRDSDGNLFYDRTGGQPAS